MTKQEEIREGIALEFFNLRCGECKDWDKCFDSHKFCETLYDRVDSFRAMLHSQGVVIKVDRELPEWIKSKYWDASGENAYRTHQQEMINAGYVAVEPLIEMVQVTEEWTPKGTKISVEPLIKE